MVCKLSCEKVLLRTDSLRSGMMALMGLALFVVAVSAIDVLGVPAGLLCLAGGVTMATSLRELWISRKIQTTNQISLNLNHELLDTDKLDHEFKRLESESKQTKDLE